MNGSYDAFFLEQLTGDDLYRLLAGENSPWTAADGTAALSHQLSAPLSPDLLTVPGMSTERLRTILTDRPPGHSFEAELTNQQPSAAILGAIKEFGRSVRHIHESPLFDQPAAAIYYAAIAAALVRLNLRISKMSDVEMSTAFTWASQCEGAENLSPLFRQALSKVQ
jgi:hypothetical protein